MSKLLTQDELNRRRVCAQLDGDGRALRLLDHIKALEEESAEFEMANNMLRARAEWAECELKRRNELAGEAQEMARMLLATTEAAKPQWVKCSDSLPEERPVPYQVMVACIKPIGGMYAGQPVRRFLQDWVVRRWPHMFIAWQYDNVGQPDQTL